MLLRRLLLLIFALAFFARWAGAQTHNGVELVKADLLAGTTAIAPGKPFTVGLRLKMAPHWHTYWQYSGDAGLPTKIEWELPAGFKAGPIQWPAPEKLVSPGDIINYGYSGETILFTEITPPAQLPPGGVTLKAKAEWLVCESTCIPGNKDLTLTLATDDAPAEANGEIFAVYRDSLPKPIDAGLALEKRVDGKDIIITLKSHPGGFEKAGEFFPLPDESLTVGHPGASELSADKSSVQTRIPVADGPKDPAKLAGVYVFRSGTALSYQIPAAQPGGEAKPAAAVPPPVAAPKPAAPAGSLAYFLLIGFLGGLILNVMPCVLPVISLKLLSFVKQANESPERVLRLGLAYTAGVFAWFLGFAILIIALKSTGQRIDYAFHQQNIWFRVGLSAATFVFALNLLGVFEIILPGSISNAAGAASGREGYAGAFVQGMLATVLGTACTAPLFGTALGFALTQSGVVILIFFAAIAAGMSLPFVVLAARPGWLRFLPKPGEWMERIKQATGFLLLATLLWVMWPLRRVGADAVLWTAALLLALGAACWVQGAFNTLASSGRSRWLARTTIALLVFGGGWFCVNRIAHPDPANNTSAVAGQSFSAQLAAALKSGRTVFVDFTADWCPNCKSNEKFVLSTDDVQKAFRDHNVMFLTADYTLKDDDIGKLLDQFNAPSVPLYVVYPAGKPDAPVVLPTLLTQQIVIDAVTAPKPLAAR